MNEVIKLLLSHRSVRKYTDRPIPQDVLDELIRCGQAAATSSFIQACTVIQVEDTGKREQLVGLTGNQDYVASAARFLVYCADMNRLKLACDMHEADTKTIGEYDERVREYYRTRTGGNKDTAWSEQISEMLVKEARPHMKAYLESRGYLLR